MKIMGVESALVIGASEIDNNFYLAIANAKKLDILPQHGANVYDIVRHESLLITREAVMQLEARLK
jgi:large subunit ribosomal protein L4